MKKRIQILILIFIGLVGCAVMLIWSIHTFANAQLGQKTEITSPSGEKTIIIDESCFLYYCEQTAYLKARFFNRELCSPNVGDPEGYVFQNVAVEWNAAEDAVEWQVETRQGLQKGIIYLDGRCEEVK